ncbi:MAG: hypothetical protein HKM02_08410 [Pseudomonadales bacterium]|nr:hypothetical protein [Pseudomonadales bacterium]
MLALRHFMFRILVLAQVVGIYLAIAYGWPWLKHLQTSTLQLDQRLDHVQVQETQDTQHTLTMLHQVQTDPSLRERWLLAEIGYDLHIAEQQLMLGRNPAEVLPLLHNADGLAASSRDDHILPLRSSLAQDLLNVQSAAQLDIPGTYLRLHAVASRLQQLPMNLVPGRSSTPVRAVSPEPITQGWKQLWQEGMMHFSHLISLRHPSSASGTLPDELERNALKWHEQALLDQAIWALLHRQNAVYQQALLDTEQLLHQHALLYDQASYQAIDNELQSLMALSIAYPQLNLDRSLKTLDSLQLGQDTP